MSKCNVEYSHMFINIDIFSYYCIYWDFESDSSSHSPKVLCPRSVTYYIYMYMCIQLVSACCLMSSEKIFQYIMARTRHILIRWWWCLHLTRPAHLFELFQTCRNFSSSLDDEKQVRIKLRTNYFRTLYGRCIWLLTSTILNYCLS
jgi:hypothetical protein